MLAGFLILGAEAGTYQLSAILAAPPSGTAVSVALVLILLGAFTKSAQMPFHSWLPGAMVAPTPVSAYLHSATMVKAGVYLIARFSPAFAPTVDWWRPVVIGVGVVTMVVAGARALRQYDLKVLLAHSTVSQLGFMVAIFGIGSAEAEAAGVALLLAHGAFKAAAFMVVGVLDHQFGTRDLRHIPRLDGSWLPLALTAVVAAGSMAGLPLLFGFVAKESVLQAIVDYGHGSFTLALVGVALGATLTAAYSARFAWGALGRDASEPVDRVPREVKPSWTFLAPGLVLTGFTLAAGVLPDLVDKILSAAEQALHPQAIGVHLSLWHGVNLALILSIVAIGSGAALFLLRRRVAPILARGRHLPDANDGYQTALRGLNILADRVTAIAQPGSLPIYTGVILLIAAAVPLWGLTAGGAWPGWPEWIGSYWHIPITAVILTSALASSVVRRRFAAALFLGATGYAMAGLFVLHGAPDLALTQVAIETLTTVLFVLVLRRLPDRFGWAGSHADPSSRPGDDHPILGPDEVPATSTMTARQRALRVAVSLAVGCSVFVLAIVMSGPEPTTTASDAMIERSLPDGHGRNVVNVTLVDFRGLDTLGEITVLASAAIGTVALARANNRRRNASGAAEQSGGGARQATQDRVHERAAPALKLGRLVTLDVAVRMVFAVVLTGSIYLLFVGHNQPGGGFVGGILAGAAVALLYVAGGLEEVRRVSRGRPWNLLGVGLLLAAGAAVVPLLMGNEVLTNGYLSGSLPVIGDIKVTSATVFDLGVYLVVLGLALMVFESFGDEAVADETEAPVVTEDTTGEHHVIAAPGTGGDR